MSEILLLNSDSDEPSPLQLAAYPDGMPIVQHNPGHGGVTYAMLLRPKSLGAFMAAMFWVDALADRGAEAPSLILPFVPGARQDRLNDSGDYLFTAKSVAKELNARNFPRVTVLDPHSDVTPALIDRCNVIHVADFMKPPPGKYAAVISPDAGAEKRASAVARKLSVPLIHAWKTRDVTTGAITGFGVENHWPETVEKNPRVLVVDDICDGGGTFIGLAQACRDTFGLMLDLHLFTTHGIYSKGVEPLKAHYSHIYCTDSIVGDRPGVIEIAVCKNLFEQGTP